MPTCALVARPEESTKLARAGREGEKQRGEPFGRGMPNHRSGRPRERIAHAFTVNGAERSTFVGATVTSDRFARRLRHRGTTLRNLRRICWFTNGAKNSKIRPANGR